MPSCDKCSQEVNLRFRVGNARYCERCYGWKPRQGPFDGYRSNTQRPIEPYFDPTTNQWITSFGQQERAGKSLKTYAHPDGVHPLGDHKTFLKKLADIRKYKQDVLAENWKEAGIRYDPKKVWSDEKGDYYHRPGKAPKYVFMRGAA